MEKITNIEIKNFKSIRHAEIKDCRKVNVFIGYPNVGKSNILEALSTVTWEKYASQYLQRDFFRFEDAAELFFEGNAREKGIISFNKTESIFTHYVNENHVKISFQKNDINGNAFISSDNEGVLSFYQLPTILKYQFEKIKIKGGEFKSLKRLDVPFGQNLYLILREFNELRKEFNDILEASYLKILLDKTSNSLKLFKTLDDDSIFQISFSLIADTLQRLIFFKAAIQSNKDSVLLFEEPEAHMFPPYISKFTNDIIFDKNDNQYFIATHSPFVLNDFMEEMDKLDLSIYAVGLRDGETTIKRLSDEQITEIYQYGVDLFFNLEDYLKDAVS